MTVRFSIFCLSVFLETCFFHPFLSGEDSLPKALDLSTAVHRALDASPEMAAAAAQVGIRIGEKQQIGLCPNPELTLDLEDFGGTKFLRNFEGADLSYVISQDLEIWGKRSARQAIATQIELASRWEYEIAKINVCAQTAHVFIEAVNIQEQEQLAEDQLQLATDIMSALEAKVESGKIPASALYRQRMALARTQSTLQRLRLQRMAAYQNLSALWECDCPDFDRVVYALDRIIPPEPLCDLCMQLDDHPELLRLEADIQAAHRTLVAERKEVLPDISVSGGVRQYVGQGTYGFIAEIDIPLPIWNQNQGNISRARNQIQFAISQKQVKQRELEKRLRMLHLELYSMYQELVMMKDQILENSQATLFSARAGYEAGKIDYLELLDAQLGYFETKEHYLDQLLSYHQKWVDLQALVALGD